MTAARCVVKLGTNEVLGSVQGIGESVRGTAPQVRVRIEQKVCVFFYWTALTETESREGD